MKRPAAAATVAGGGRSSPGRPKSPPFAMSREPVEQLLEKPRYSAGWYRKADRNRQEAADAPVPMPHTEAALAAAAPGTPARGSADAADGGAAQLTPKENTKETWSVVYQEASDMVSAA